MLFTLLVEGWHVRLHHVLEVGGGWLKLEIFLLQFFNGRSVNLVVSHLALDVLLHLKLILGDGRLAAMKHYVSRRRHYNDLHLLRGSQRPRVLRAAGMRRLRHHHRRRFRVFLDQLEGSEGRRNRPFFLI